jgi:aminopeptidase N
MPGINISRNEALERSSHLSVESYEVFLDVTGTGDTFFARSTVKFTCNQIGYDTFIDSVAERVISATLNGSPVDTNSFDGESIYLKNLQSENTLVIEVESLYSKNGEGLQKSFDPVDNETYLYSQGETAYIRRMYPCFDQPNLKATFTLSVLAPEHWEVVSNNPVAHLAKDGESKLWNFKTTPRISTYITALLAGPYHHVHDEYVGEKVVPLGIYCRKSLAESLDPEEIFQTTKEGFAYFEQIFGLAYPFEKYDQAAVVDFNWGAMENAGLVTFREDLLVFRSRVTDRKRESRAHVILHEMAHMWFGNMVTMYWWDDLWLNESFAEWTSYLALIEATRFKHGWTSFIMDNKSWAFEQDQLVSTHPIAVHMEDIHSVNANFDGISYAKGASVLHQLMAYIGRENFIKGLQTYFTKFAWQNTQLSDLLHELEVTSGKDLKPWSETWLKTAGVNTLSPVIGESEGRYSSVAIKQGAPSIPVGSQEIRPHRLAIALYDLLEGQLVVRKRTEIDVTSELTLVPEFVGEKIADLFLINDSDLTYSKVHFDQRSIDTAKIHFGDISDPITRVLVGTYTWDMWRDAEISSHDFVDLLLEGLKSETLINVLSALAQDVVSVVEENSNPATRDALLEKCAAILQELLLVAEPSSDSQLIFARTFAALAESVEQVAFIKHLVSAGESGLVIDRELRWFLTIELAKRGEIIRAEIDEVLASDQTITGELSHSEAIAALPDPAIKATTWSSILNDQLTNSQRIHLAQGFMQPNQIGLLTEYVDPYFDALLKIWSSTSFEEASTKVSLLYPRYIVSQTTLDKTDNWLNGVGKDAPAVLRRLVAEARDSLSRNLRIQIKDGAQL